MRFRAHRYPTRYPVTLTAQGVQMASTVTSVSTSGVCLALRDPLAVGEDIILNYASGQISGTVRWLRDGKAGVTFSRPLAPRDVERLRFGVQSAVLRRTHSTHLTELR